MVNIEKWLKEREKKDKILYERYGKPLEKKHKGKLVVIGPNGETIVGENDVELVKQAIERFGSGNFAFRRVGYSYTGKWLDAKSE